MQWLILLAARSAHVDIAPVRYVDLPTVHACINVVFSQLFLCLSRACLGKMIVSFSFYIESGPKRRVFRTVDGGVVAHRGVVQHALPQRHALRVRRDRQAEVLEDGRRDINRLDQRIALSVGIGVSGIVGPHWYVGNLVEEPENARSSFLSAFPMFVPSLS